MTRLIFFVAFLSTNFCYASWPLIHFLKCKITTPDTVVIGYFRAPLEDEPDSVIAKLMTNKKYFMERVFNHLSTIELNAFTYIHYYKIPDDSTVVHCIYQSTDKLLIDAKTITNIELIDVVNFQFVPNRVITRIQEEDIPWLTKKVLKVYQDNDKCYPFRFLVYDDKADYDSIIKDAMIQPEQKEDVMKTFSKYKILAIRLNQCD